MIADMKVAVSESGNRVIIFLDGQPVETQLHDDEIVVDLNNYNDFIKPKWDGSKWTESATQLEIDQLMNRSNPPSPEQRLNVVEQNLSVLDQTDIVALEAIAQTYEENLVLKQQNADLTQKLTQAEARLTMAESDSIAALEGTVEIYESLIAKGVL